jgi:hypothetical protein
MPRNFANPVQMKKGYKPYRLKPSPKRFPSDLMFKLTKEEWEALRFQIETSDNSDILTPQIVSLKAGR